MKKLFLILISWGMLYSYAFAQIDTVKLNELVVLGSKIPLNLKSTSNAVSIIDSSQLALRTRSLSADQVLAAVPGVLVDNQHDSRKIHLAIRGQGILTERGIRGISIVLDGIPLNDPAGFVPDLYDVDWATVQSVEVVRGLMSGVYGASGSAGTIIINTDDGCGNPLCGNVSATAGSYGYKKVFAQIGGQSGNTNYILNVSNYGGNGYRVHQGFYGKNLYGKITFKPADKLEIKQIFSFTDYFQQNPEGLNLGQFDDLRQANPDAVPFNEYQKTQRFLFGAIAKYKFSESLDFQYTGYFKPWRYKETSNKAAEYRSVLGTGNFLQMNVHKGSSVKHDFSVGLEQKSQRLNLYRLKSEPIPGRVDAIDDLNLESDSLLTNENLLQQSISPYALYELSAGKWHLNLSLRYDKLYNSMFNRMLDLDSAFSNMSYEKLSYRAGLTFDLSDWMIIYTSYGTGFVPPSVEELANNPLGYSGFNTSLVPAVNSDIDLGFRGVIADRLYYDITAFSMNTQNDFFRFKLTDRGNQEVFYGNAGDSRRLGLEMYLNYEITKYLQAVVSFTYSDFKYVSTANNPLFEDTTLILTRPPEPGQYLPNVPKYNVFAQLILKPVHNLTLTFSGKYRSPWVIYTDSRIYDGLADPSIYQPWYEGYNIYDFSANYAFDFKNMLVNMKLGVENLFDTPYIAFTEPDPDGNSYHPGSGRQIFLTISMKIK